MSYLAGNASDNKDILPRHEINCDMGEGFGPWKMGPDAELMPLIDTANVACGGHAGDPRIMQETVRLAKKYNVRVGAHPGLPDPLGFGRRRWEIAPEDIYTMTLYQVGALKGFLDAEGMPLAYIKPHGELFFYVQREPEVLKAVLRVCKVYKVPLVASKSTKIQKITEEEGVQFIQEVYPDLVYVADGGITKPASSGKAARTPDIIGSCVTGAIVDDKVESVEGHKLKLNFSGAPISFCLHSDFPTALENAKAVRKAIDAGNQKVGYSIKSGSS